MNAPFPWVGGKGKLLWIIDELAPYSYDCFVDVFGGSGTVLLNRPLKTGRPEIYNDRDSNLTNFMRTLRHRPLALLSELGFLPIHSREDFILLCKFLDHKEDYETFEDEELALADLFFLPIAARIIKRLILRHSSAVRLSQYPLRRRLHPGFHQMRPVVLPADTAAL